MLVDSERLTVVVEDSINGRRAAVAAGMTCYGFAGGLSVRDELAATGTTVFDSMSELCAILLGDRDLRYR